MANDIRIMTEAELREVVALDVETVDVIEAAFAALAGGEVVMPPILSMDLPAANGEVDVKTAYIPGFEGFAIKVSPGFFDNPKLGLPSLNGLMILFSAQTGLVKALFLDNGYLTDIRTAAAGAVAARHLAPEVVKTAGVIGTGVQARLQMQAAHLVRPFERVIVWGRDEQKAAECAKDLKNSLGVEAEIVSDPAQLVAESQLVVTTTPARGAGAEGRVAASGAACDGDGVGPGREERDRGGGAGEGGPVCGRPGEPDREGGRAAQCDRGGALDRRHAGGTGRCDHEEEWRS